MKKPAAKTLIKSLAAALAILLSQCRHGGEGNSSPSGSGLRAGEMDKREAVLTDNKNAQEDLLIQPNTIFVSEIVRPKADLREGPSVEYNLMDVTLPAHTQLVLLEQLDHWQKVYVPEYRVSGWIHGKAMGQKRVNDRYLSIPMRKLPIVTVVRPNRSALSFPELQPINVVIPRGKVFVSLRKTPGRTLVVFKEDQSLAWLAQEDLQ